MIPERLPDWVLEAPEATRASLPAKEGFVEDEHGVRVFYEVHGDSADTVCLLPPWPIAHLRTWRAQLPYLARHFRVIAIDPRGNGRSDRPRDWEAYSRARVVAHVVSVLDATDT